MRSAAEILDAATEEQVRSWMASIEKSEWPADMPVPAEALRCVWQKLQRRFMDLPHPKPKKGGK